MPQITQLIKKLKTENFHKLNKMEKEENNFIHHIHQKWESYCNALPPNVFISLDSAVTPICKRSFSPRNSRFSVEGFNDQMSKSHSNHKHYYQLFNLFILELNSFIRNRQIDHSCYSFTCQRALKNSNGEYELLKVVTQPYSLSNQGIVEDFISWYIPLKKYDGEPFLSDIESRDSFTDPSFDRLKMNFYDSKKEVIHYMQFTKRQKEALRLMSKGDSKSELAQKMKISIRTIEKYNQQILSRGQDLFPSNSFITAMGVVEYLQKMGIL